MKSPDSDISGFSMIKYRYYELFPDFEAQPPKITVRTGFAPWWYNVTEDPFKLSPHWCIYTKDYSLKNAQKYITKLKKTFVDELDKELEALAKQKEIMIHTEVDLEEDR